MDAQLRCSRMIVAPAASTRRAGCAENTMSRNFNPRRQRFTDLRRAENLDAVEQRLDDALL